MCRQLVTRCRTAPISAAAAAAAAAAAPPPTPTLPPTGARADGAGDGSDLEDALSQPDAPGKVIKLTVRACVGGARNALPHRFCRVRCASGSMRCRLAGRPSPIRSPRRPPVAASVSHAGRWRRRQGDCHAWPGLGGAREGRQSARCPLLLPLPPLLPLPLAPNLMALPLPLLLCTCPTYPSTTAPPPLYRPIVPPQCTTSAPCSRTAHSSTRPVTAASPLSSRWARVSECEGEGLLRCLLLSPGSSLPRWCKLHPAPTSTPHPPTLCPPPPQATKQAR